jgi:hypothetical protein
VVCGQGLLAKICRNCGGVWAKVYYTIIQHRGGYGLNLEKPFEMDANVLYDFPGGKRSVRRGACTA